jgi:type III secretion system needle length determinant
MEGRHLEAPDAESQELFKRLSQNPETGRQGPASGPGQPPLAGSADGPGDAFGPREPKPGLANEPREPDGFGAKPQLAAKDEIVEESLSSLISAALGGRTDTVTPLPQVSGPTAPVDTAEAQDLAEKLISRVLVADSTSQGQSVRLIVDPAVLPGTEIHLDRGLDGFLNVTLVSNDPNSLQTLIQARGELEQALNRSEGAAFRLNVEEDRGDRDAQGDSSERQSSGLDFVDSQD